MSVKVDTGQTIALERSGVAHVYRWSMGLKTENDKIRTICEIARYERGPIESKIVAG